MAHTVSLFLRDLSDYTGLVFKRWKVIVAGIIVSIATAIVKYFVGTSIPGWLVFLGVAVSIGLAGFLVWRTNHARLIAGIKAVETGLRPTEITSGNTVVDYRRGCP